MERSGIFKKAASIVANKNNRSAVNKKGGNSYNANLEVMKFPAQARQIKPSKPNSCQVSERRLDGNADSFI